VVDCCRKIPKYNDASTHHTATHSRCKVCGGKRCNTSHLDLFFIFCPWKKHTHNSRSQWPPHLKLIFWPHRFTMDATFGTATILDGGKWQCICLFTLIYYLFLAELPQTDFMAMHKIFVHTTMKKTSHLLTSHYFFVMLVVFKAFPVQPPPQPKNSSRHPLVLHLAATPSGSRYVAVQGAMPHSTHLITILTWHW